jgi:hypothetical protein
MRCAYFVHVEPCVRDDRIRNLDRVQLEVISKNITGPGFGAQLDEMRR